MASFGGLAKPDRGASLRVISFSHEERLIFDMKSGHVQLTAPSIVIDHLLQSRLADGFLVTSRSADGILTLTRVVLMELGDENAETPAGAPCSGLSTLVQYVIFPQNRAKVAAVEIWVEPQEGRVKQVAANPAYLHGASSSGIVRRIRAGDEAFIAALQTFDHVKGLPEVIMAAGAYSAASLDGGSRLAQLPQVQEPNTIRDHRAGANVILFPVAFNLASLLKRSQRHDLLFALPKTRPSSDSPNGSGAPLVERVAFDAMVDTERVQAMSRVPTASTTFSAPPSTGGQPGSQPTDRPASIIDGEGGVPAAKTTKAQSSFQRPCPYVMSNILVSQFAQNAQRLCDMEIPIESRKAMASLIAMLGADADHPAGSRSADATATFLRPTQYRCFLKYACNESFFILLVPAPDATLCSAHSPEEAHRCALREGGGQGFRPNLNVASSELHDKGPHGQGTSLGGGEPSGVGAPPADSWAVHLFHCHKEDVLCPLFGGPRLPVVSVVDLRDEPVANHTIIDAELHQAPTPQEMSLYLADAYSRAFVQSAFLRLQQNLYLSQTDLDNVLDACFITERDIDVSSVYQLLAAAPDARLAVDLSAADVKADIQRRFQTILGHSFRRLPYEGELLLLSNPRIGACELFPFQRVNEPHNLTTPTATKAGASDESPAHPVENSVGNEGWETPGHLLSSAPSDAALGRSHSDPGGILEEHGGKSRLVTALFHKPGAHISEDEEGSEDGEDAEAGEKRQFEASGAPALATDHLDRLNLVEAAFADDTVKGTLGEDALSAVTDAAVQANDIAAGLDPVSVHPCFLQIMCSVRRGAREGGGRLYHIRPVSELPTDAYQALGQEGLRANGSLSREELETSVARGEVAIHLHIHCYNLPPDPCHDGEEPSSPSPESGGAVAIDGGSGQADGIEGGRGREAQGLSFFSDARPSLLGRHMEESPVSSSQHSSCSSTPLPLGLRDAAATVHDEGQGSASSFEPALMSPYRRSRQASVRLSEASETDDGLIHDPELAMAAARREFLEGSGLPPPLRVHVDRLSRELEWLVTDELISLRRQHHRDWTARDLEHVAAHVSQQKPVLSPAFSEIRHLELVVGAPQGSAAAKRGKPSEAQVSLAELLLKRYFTLASLDHHNVVRLGAFFVVLPAPQAAAEGRRATATATNPRLQRAQSGEIVMNTNKVFSWSAPMEWPFGVWRDVNVDRITEAGAAAEAGSECGADAQGKDRGAPSGQQLQGAPFHLLVRADESSVTIYFHTRSMSLNPTELHAISAVRAAVRRTFHRINQQLLLEEVEATKVANMLLIPPDLRTEERGEGVAASGGADVASDSDDDDDGEQARQPSHPRPRAAVAGGFACPIQYRCLLRVHPRLPAREVLPVLHGALEAIHVHGSPQWYVYRESQQRAPFLFHLKLCRNCGQTEAAEGDPVLEDVLPDALMSRSKSNRTDSARVLEEVRRTSLQSAAVSEPGSTHVAADGPHPGTLPSPFGSSSAAAGGQQGAGAELCVALEVYSIFAVSMQAASDLIQMVSSRLDTATQTMLSVDLARNSRNRLLATDLEFLQGLGGLPPLHLYVPLPAALGPLEATYMDLLEQHVLLYLDRYSVRTEQLDSDTVSRSSINSDYSTRTSEGQRSYLYNHPPRTTDADGLGGLGQQTRYKGGRFGAFPRDRSEPLRPADVRHQVTQSVGEGTTIVDLNVCEVQGAADLVQGPATGSTAPLLRDDRFNGTACPPGNGDAVSSAELWLQVEQCCRTIEEGAHFNLQEASRESPRLLRIQVSGRGSADLHSLARFIMASAAYALWDCALETTILQPNPRTPLLCQHPQRTEQEAADANSARAARAQLLPGVQSSNLERGTLRRTNSDTAAVGNGAFQENALGGIGGGGSKGRDAAAAGSAGDDAPNAPVSCMRGPPPVLRPHVLAPWLHVLSRSLAASHPYLQHLNFPLHAGVDLRLLATQLGHQLESHAPRIFCTRPAAPEWLPDRARDGQAPREAAAIQSLLLHLLRETHEPLWVLLHRLWSTDTTWELVDRRSEADGSGGRADSGSSNPFDIPASATRLADMPPASDGGGFRRRTTNAKPEGGGAFVSNQAFLIIAGHVPWHGVSVVTEDRVEARLASPSGTRSRSGGAAKKDQQAGSGVPPPNVPSGRPRRSVRAASKSQGLAHRPATIFVLLTRRHLLAFTHNFSTGAGNRLLGNLRDIAAWHVTRHALLDRIMLAKLGHFAVAARSGNDEQARAPLESTTLAPDGETRGHHSWAPHAEALAAKDGAAAAATSSLGTAGFPAMSLVAPRERSTIATTVGTISRLVLAVELPALLRHEWCPDHRTLRELGDGSPTLFPETAQPAASEGDKARRSSAGSATAVAVAAMAARRRGQASSSTGGLAAKPSSGDAALSRSRARLLQRSGSGGMGGATSASEDGGMRRSGGAAGNANPQRPTAAELSAVAEAARVDLVAQLRQGRLSPGLCQLPLLYEQSAVTRHGCHVLAIMKEQNGQRLVAVARRQLHLEWRDQSRRRQAALNMGRYFEEVSVTAQLPELLKPSHYCATPVLPRQIVPEPQALGTGVELLAGRGYPSSVAGDATARKEGGSVEAAKRHIFPGGDAFEDDEGLTMPAQEALFHVQEMQELQRLYVQYAVEKLDFMESCTVRESSGASLRSLASSAPDVPVAVRDLRTRKTYLQSCRRYETPTGVLLLEVFGQGMHLCVKLYILHGMGFHTQLRLPLLPSQRDQMAAPGIFTQRCSHTEDLVHVNSFAYDFHVRRLNAIFKAGRLPAPTFCLSAVLRELTTWHKQAPTYAHNLIGRPGLCLNALCKYGKGHIPASSPLAAWVSQEENGAAAEGYDRRTGAPLLHTLVRYMARCPHRYGLRMLEEKDGTKLLYVHGDGFGDDAIRHGDATLVLICQQEAAPESDVVLLENAMGTDGAGGGGGGGGRAADGRGDAHGLYFYFLGSDEAHVVPRTSQERSGRLLEPVLASVPHQTCKHFAGLAVAAERYVGRLLGRAYKHFWRDAAWRCLRKAVAAGSAGPADGSWNSTGAVGVAGSSSTAKALPQQHNAAHGPDTPTTRGSTSSAPSVAPSARRTFSLLSRRRGSATPSIDTAPSTESPFSTTAEQTEPILLSVPNDMAMEGAALLGAREDTLAGASVVRDLLQLSQEVPFTRSDAHLGLLLSQRQAFATVSETLFAAFAGRAVFLDAEGTYAPLPGVKRRSAAVSAEASGSVLIFSSTHSSVAAMVRAGEDGGAAVPLSVTLLFCGARYTLAPLTGRGSDTSEATSAGTAVQGIGGALYSPAGGASMRRGGGRCVWGSTSATELRTNFLRIPNFSFTANANARDPTKTQLAPDDLVLDAAAQAHIEVGTRGWREKQRGGGLSFWVLATDHWHVVSSLARMFFTFPFLFAGYNQRFVPGVMEAIVNGTATVETFNLI
jgi:hypothetical protein